MPDGADITVLSEKARAAEALAKRSLTAYQLVHAVAVGPTVGALAYLHELPAHWIDNPASVPAVFWVFAVPATALVTATMVLFILAAIRAGKSSRAAAELQRAQLA